MTSSEYDRFRHEAVHTLQSLNDELDKHFGLSNWPRWDYDLEAGTLTFSEDGIPKVVASIQVVGTTSTTSGTWMWAWANSNLPVGVTAGSREVERFGRTECLDQLTEASLPDDEYLGWALTAITSRIVGAKGAYRCLWGNGFLYLVYTEIAFADSKNSKRPPPRSDSTECEVHGNGQPTYICEHLLAHPEQEWFSSDCTEENPWPDAWCAKCDETFQTTGEWTDENSAGLNIKVLCHRCYESLRSKELA